MESEKERVGGRREGQGGEERAVQVMAGKRRTNIKRRSECVGTIVKDRLRRRDDARFSIWRKGEKVGEEGMKKKSYIKENRGKKKKKGRTARLEMRGDIHRREWKDCERETKTATYIHERVQEERMEKLQKVH